MQEVSHVGSEQTIRVGSKKTLNDQYSMMNRNMMFKSIQTIETIERLKELPKISQQVEISAARKKPFEEPPVPV